MPTSSGLALAGKLSMRQGMAISADQPVGVRLAAQDQSPFHSSLLARPPLLRAEGVPRGLVENRALSSHRNERKRSSITSTLSSVSESCRWYF